MFNRNKADFCKQVALAFARDDANIALMRRQPAKYAASVAVVYAATEAALEQCKTLKGVTEIATLLQAPSEKLQELLQTGERAPRTQNF